MNPKTNEPPTPRERLASTCKIAEQSDTEAPAPAAPEGDAEYQPDTTKTTYVRLAEFCKAQDDTTPSAA